MGFLGGGGEILDGSITSDKLDPSVLSSFFNDIAENKLNLLELNAGASVNFSHDGAILEIFNDADGLNNSVNVGNTTTIFDTNAYHNKTIISDDTEYSRTSATSASMHDFTGINSTIATSVIAADIKSNGGYAFAKIKYYYDDATDAFSGEVSTNSSSYVSKTFSNPSPSKVVEHFEIWGRNDIGNTCFVKNMNIPTNVGANKFIQLNQQAIPTNLTSIYVYSDGETAGTGSRSFDYSIDGGEWVTDQELFIKIPISVSVGTLDVKLNLNGVGVGNTATAENVAVLGL